MRLRLAQASDLPELATLFRQTVRTHGPHYYSPAQTQAWAVFADAINPFEQFILAVTTFVAVDDRGSIAGFAGIADDGHVASAYVRHDCIHQGIGSILMQTLLDYAEEHHIPHLYAEASSFSLGLFKKFGFRLYGTETVERQGVMFERFLVELHRQV